MSTAISVSVTITQPGKRAPAVVKTFRVSEKCDGAVKAAQDKNSWRLGRGRKPRLAHRGQPGHLIGTDEGHQGNRGLVNERPERESGQGDDPAHDVEGTESPHAVGILERGRHDHEGNEAEHQGHERRETDVLLKLYAKRQNALETPQGPGDAIRRRDAPPRIAHVRRPTNAGQQHRQVNKPRVNHGTSLPVLAINDLARAVGVAPSGSLTRRGHHRVSGSAPSRRVHLAL